MRYDRKTAVAYAREYAGCTDDYQSGIDADATAFVMRCVEAGATHGAGGIPVVTCGPADVLPGDIIQIRTRAGLPYKSLIVTEKNGCEILVAAHSYISCDRPLQSYKAHEIRCFHFIDQDLTNAQDRHILV